MASRPILSLAYGAVFVATALRAGHRFWLHGRVRIALAAQGTSVLAVLLLAGGLTLYGFEVGYWPFHTAYELLNVGLLGLLLAGLTLLSPQRDVPFWSTLLVLASLLAVYGVRIGGTAEPAAFVYDSGWWVAYGTLSGFGGGAMVVAGATAVMTLGRESEALESAVTRRALAWGWLTLSAGLASGAWWFHRLSGRYWGDVRWTVVAIAGLLGAAAWHGRREWLERGWRSALVGVVLGLVGGYVVLGLGGGG